MGAKSNFEFSLDRLLMLIVYENNPLSPAYAQICSLHQIFNVFMRKEITE